MKKNKTLDEHFKDSKDLTKRNLAIIKTLDDGYKQADIARYLGLSSSAIAKVRKNYE